MAACTCPLYIKNKTTGHMVHVPCGKCHECLSGRVSQWSFRLMQQDKISTNALFITLTYDTNKVPVTKRGFMSLSKRDVQLFYKRLRKLHDLFESLDKSKRNPNKIKYYTVGEYGDKTTRPHYHALLFNAKVELIQPAWGMGEIHYGEVTAASVGYTLKYMCKPSRIPLHKNDDRLPEFALMSKGIGIDYINDKNIEWHKAKLLERMYVNVGDGKKAGMPRYYKDKIYTEEERKLISEKSKETIQKEQQKQKDKQGKQFYHNQFERHIASKQTQKKSYENGRNKV